MFSDLAMWGFFKYMRQILKTFMLTLLDETSLTAIRVPHPFSIQTLSLSLLDLSKYSGLMPNPPPPSPIYDNDIFQVKTSKVQELEEGVQ